MCRDSQTMTKSLREPEAGREGAGPQSRLGPWVGAGLWGGVGVSAASASMVPEWIWIMGTLWGLLHLPNTVG